MHASERHSARLTSVREWTWSSIATLPLPLAPPSTPPLLSRKLLFALSFANARQARDAQEVLYCPTARAGTCHPSAPSPHFWHALSRRLQGPCSCSCSIPPTPPHLSSHSTSVYSHFPTLGCPHPRSWNITRRTSTSHLNG